MPLLKEKALMKDFQIYVSELEHERGFFEQSAQDKCLLLGEEVGETIQSRSLIRWYRH